MLALLVSPDHGQRLRELLARFRREEADLADLLGEVQHDLEQAHQVLARERLYGVSPDGHIAGTDGFGGADDARGRFVSRASRFDEAWPGHQAAMASLRLLCSELEAQHEAVATELMHVRLAVAGTEEELARHDFLRHDLANARSTSA